MAKKKSFVIYENWAKLISECPDEQAGQLIKAICNYKLGNEVRIDNPMVNAMFEMIRDILDKDAEKYDVICEKKREAIEKRWKKKNEEKNTDVFTCIEKNTDVFKSIQVDTDNDNENDNGNDNVNDNDNEVLQSNTHVTKMKQSGKKEKAEKIVEMYHTQCPSLPKVIKLTDARIRCINSRLKEFTEEDIETAFIKVENSPFLKGEKGDWKASFDWIMKSGNLAKILEGNYDSGGKNRIDIVDTW